MANGKKYRSHFMMSAIMNIEPVCALVLAWLLLGQAIAPVQIAGALIVVGTVMVLGLRRRR